MNAAAKAVILTIDDDEGHANVRVTKPVDYGGFSNAIRQLGLFMPVMQVAESP